MANKFNKSYDNNKLFMPAFSQYRKNDFILFSIIQSIALFKDHTLIISLENSGERVIFQ